MSRGSVATQLSCSGMFITH